MFDEQGRTILESGSEDSEEEEEDDTWLNLAQLQHKMVLHSQDEGGQPGTVRRQAVDSGKSCLARFEKVALGSIPEGFGSAGLTASSKQGFHRVEGRLKNVTWYLESQWVCLCTE